MPFSSSVCALSNVNSAGHKNSRFPWQLACVLFSIEHAAVTVPGEHTVGTLILYVCATPS